jgi:hypothetical protein
VKRCLGDFAFKLLQFRIISRGLAPVAVLLPGSSENGCKLFLVLIVIGCKLFLD